MTGDIQHHRASSLFFFVYKNKYFKAVLVVTNHHDARLISWLVGPTERRTLKSSCKSEHTREGKARSVGPAKHACMEKVLCLQTSRECWWPRQHPHWRRGSSSLYRSILSGLCQQLPQSSRLMQSWALLIVFLTSICDCILTSRAGLHWCTSNRWCILICSISFFWLFTLCPTVHPYDRPKHCFTLCGVWI